MAITVRVISENGWQNGTELIPKDQMRDLVCDESRIKAYIDNGVLEVVNAKIQEEPENDEKRETTEEIIDRTTKSIVQAFKEMKPDELPIPIKDRVEDDPQGGFKSLGEFCSCVWKTDNPDNNQSMPEIKKIREWDARVKTTGHMAEYDSEQGGHLVPTGFVPNLLQNALENSIVRPRATYILCATNAVSIPVLADYDHRPAGSGLFGAMQIKRPGEAEQKDPSKPKFEKVTLTLHKMVVLTYVSDELLEDSPISVEPLLNDTFGQCIAWHEDKTIVPCRRKAA